LKIFLMDLDSSLNTCFFLALSQTKIRYMEKRPLDALVIVFTILIAVWGLTWIIPSGAYERELIQGKQVLVPESYHLVSGGQVSFWRIFTSPVKGLSDAGLVVAFVLLIGGAFGVVTKTKALEAGLRALVKTASRYPGAKSILVALLMFFFSLAGNTFGMAEEVLVFILITIPLARDMGYDTISGVAIPFVGSAVGFAGAAFNPFTVGIAQGLSDLPPFSGAIFRSGVWLVFTFVAIVFVLRHNKKVLISGPTKGLEPALPVASDAAPLVFTWQHKTILGLFAVVLCLLIYGANSLDWYIEEIAGLFIAFGLLAGAISGLSPGSISRAFISGASDLLMAALVIGFSRAILVIAEEGQIIDTMLYHLANLVGDLPDYLAAQSMFLVQGFINFFIPSGTGQAALTMPVMAPLSDLLGIHRQTAVLCFQFGDGIFNLIIPTSGVTMGILSLAGIPFKVWLKWIWKLILALMIVSMVAIAISVRFPVW
jgi:uncharacterized ion transporter superfamily protein YfcC